VCDEHVSVGSTTTLHLHSLQPETVMEITMTHALLEIENRILRDEEFIHSQSEDMISDLEDLSEFRSIGDVIKQMSFNFHA
jgi:hypothetical protein